jgi:ferredoxin
MMRAFGKNSKQLPERASKWNTKTDYHKPNSTRVQSRSLISESARRTAREAASTLSPLPHTVIDHHYEFVLSFSFDHVQSRSCHELRLILSQCHCRWCRRCWSACSRGARRIGTEHGVYQQTLSNSLAYRCRTRWYQRCTRQHDRRRLAMAYVRYCERI